MKDIITHKSREVTHCPPHFIKVPIKIEGDITGMRPVAAFSSDEKVVEIQTLIRTWLHENCEHRFYLGNHVDPVSGFLVESFIVSFERPADATYFTLLLPKFTKKK